LIFTIILRADLTCKNEIDCSDEPGFLPLFHNYSNIAWKAQSLSAVGAPPGGVASIRIAGAGACPFKAVFGIPCPGCGLTAAVDELVHGHVLASLRTHAFAPIFLAGFFRLFWSHSCCAEKQRQKNGYQYCPYRISHWPDRLAV